MANWVRMTVASALIGLVGASEAVEGQQVIERDTKLTGPRGRTIERDIRVQRGPGYIDRQVEIKRPGETLIRDTRIQTPVGRPYGGPGFGGPGFSGGPRFYGRPIVENVIVQRPPVFAGFLGLPAFSLFLGGNSAPPPPPPPQVVVVPEPAYGYPQPQPQPPVVVEAPPPQPADAFTDAIGRLKSFHSHSRRDGALTLGRLGDDRAVGSLIDRLEHDSEKEVRVAAAWALGEIGDERSALALQRVSLDDKKHEVREAAQIAYRKLPRPGQDPNPTTGQLPVSPQNRVIRSNPEILDPGPGPALRPNPGDPPPPPPVPAGEPPLERPGTAP
jgi:hypothetical protein